MFALTKANIDVLDLNDLQRIYDALTLLNNYGIDNDRMQTITYVNNLIKHIKERNAESEK